MVKCSKAEVRRLKTALRWRLPPVQRERIQMVLLRESGMTQLEIAQCMGVSLSTVNRAHMAYDYDGIKALRPKPNGGRKHENMTLAQERALYHFHTDLNRKWAPTLRRHEGGSPSHPACDSLETI
jgi:IS30 family transposase